MGRVGKVVEAEPGLLLLCASAVLPKSLSHDVVLAESFFAFLLPPQSKKEKVRVCW